MNQTRVKIIISPLKIPLAIRVAGKNMLCQGDAKKNPDKQKSSGLTPSVNKLNVTETHDLRKKKTGAFRQLFEHDSSSDISSDEDDMVDPIWKPIKKEKLPNLLLLTTALDASNTIGNSTGVQAPVENVSKINRE